MNAATLEFYDANLERKYKALQFRGAFALHITYSLSLLTMFIGGAFDGSFHIASITLGPGFLAVLCIRIALHRQQDDRWAQAVGTWLMTFLDAGIWVASAWVFRTWSVSASALIYGLYSITMVLYPIVLMVRTFSHTQRTAVAVVAMIATTASPVWVANLTQLDFVVTNLTALTVGTLFAYFMERLKRENELMHVAAMKAAHENATADSRLNHILKNKIMFVDHRIELARSELSERASDAALKQPAASGAADAMLLGAQQSLSSCVEWIHRREVFLQLAHGHYQSSQQLVRVHDVLRGCAGPRVTLTLSCPAMLSLDVAAVALALEEAMSNAFKYGDPNVPTMVRASADLHERAQGVGDAAVNLKLRIEVDSVNPAGAQRLTPAEAQRAFEHGFKGASTPDGFNEGKNLYSDGIGLPAARSAAHAAHGTVELITLEDDLHRAQAEPSPVGIEATEAQKEVANPAPLEPWTEAHRVAPRSKSSRAKGEPRTEQPEAIRPDPKRPACVVVDDDDLVQMAVAMQIESIGAHEVQALGATLEEQLRMEDVIMGVRRAEDLDVELPLPHTPAEVAVIDLNLSLPPPWPPHLQAQRADGRPLLPEDGLDLARRLRARGFEGKLFLHTAESRDSLEALRRQHIEIDDVFEKSSALRFKQEFKEALAL